MKWIVLLICSAIGLPALIGGAAWLLKRYPLYANGIHTQGVVVESYESYSSSGGRMRGQEPPGVSVSYYPVVEFQIEEGEKIRFEGSTGSLGTPDYNEQVGSKVEVIYDRRNPHNAQIYTFSQFWLGPLVITIVGLVFFLFGIVFFFMISKSDKHFGPDFYERLSREALTMSKGAICVSGIANEIKEREGSKGKEFVVIVSARMPDRVSEETFESIPIFMDRAGSRLLEQKGRILGQPVDIYIDPYNRSHYYVNLDPLLTKLMKTDRRYW